MHLPLHNSTNSTVGAVRDEARASHKIRRDEGVGGRAAGAGVAGEDGGSDAVGMGAGGAAGRARCRVSGNEAALVGRVALAEMRALIERADGAKMQRARERMEAARKLGVKVEFVKGDKDVLARITDSPEPERPALLVFDLNNAAAKPLTVIPKLRAKLKKSVSIIGFLSHLQGDLKMKATEAGCDTVMPRSAFSQSLPNLLRRYGMEEEEDNYPQPV